MKQASFILNIVLFIAVAVLYYLHFSEKKPVSAEAVPSSKPMALPKIPLPKTSIVFVNSDSLLDQYEFLKQQRRSMEASQQRMQNELKTQGEKLQAEIQEYQQQAAGLTEFQRQQKEEALGAKQQAYLAKKDEMMAKLDQAQEKYSEELFDKLSAYLRDFNRDKNYQFILGYQKGGGILFANDSLNITRQVIDGLNSAYKAEVKK